MKKVEFKFVDIVQTQKPDELIATLNQEGALGWHFVHAVGVPGGMKFMMQRETDENVYQADLDAYDKAKKDAELLARFGLGNATSSDPRPVGPNDTVMIRR